MKKIILIGLLLVAQLIMAKTITVNNNIGLQTAMFTELQDAIDTAVTGDIILIKGSNTSYGNITLTKQLTFIGEGHTTSLNSTKTQIGKVSFTSDNSSGTIFKSLLIGQLSSSLKIDLLHFDNINFNYSYNTTFGENWTFLQSIISIKLIYPCTIHNCILDWIETDNNKVTAGTLVAHSIIKYFRYSPSLIHFENCIFTAEISNTNNDFPKNCVFVNALFTNNSSFTEDTLVQKQNIISASLFKTKALFVNTTHYQIESNSPAKAAGKNGADIGVTGGLHPVKEFYGENNLPKVYNHVIETAVITPGAPLKMKFSVRRKIKE